MLNLLKFDDEETQKEIDKLLHFSDVVHSNGDKENVQVGTYVPLALTRMVKNCYVKNHPSKIHPIVIATIISKIIHWHDWSARNNRSNGEFYKSRKQWEQELEVSRYEIGAAEEFLKDLNSLSTELRDGNRKYWILNKEWVDYVYTVYVLVETLQNRPDSSPEVQELILSEAKSVAENSQYFAMWLVNFTSNSDLNRETPLGCPTTEVGCPTTEVGCPTTDITIYSQYTEHKNTLKKHFTTKVVKGRISADPPSGGADAPPLREVPETAQLELERDEPSQGEDHDKGFPEKAKTPTPHSPPSPKVEFDTQELQGATMCAEEYHEENEMSNENDSSGNAHPGYSENQLTGEREQGQNRSKPRLGGVTPPKPHRASTGRSKQIKAAPEEIKLLPVVEAWNSLPSIPESQGKLTKHSFDNSGYVNKTVKSILERLVIVSRGELLEKYPDVKTWSSSAEIDFKTAHEPMSVNALVQVVKTYRRYFDPGFGVSDKSALKTSLHEFLGLYTVKARKGEFFEHRSWFWEILNRGPVVPVVINYDVYEERLKQYPSVTTKLKKVMMDSEEWRPKWSPRVPKILSRLLYTYQTIYKNTYLLYHRTSKASDWLTAMSSFDSFVSRYIEFTTAKFENVFPGHFDPTGKNFQNFITHGRDAAKVDLDPSKTVAQTMQRNRAVSLYTPRDIVIRNGVQVWYNEEEMELIDSGQYNPWWAMEQIV